MTATRVNIEAEAWTDIRFAALARLLGLPGGHEHALILCAKIWAWQTANYTPQTPTYAVDEALVDGVLGAGGAAAMVRARLAEETPDGFRIKGSEGRIEWLYRLAENGRKRKARNTEVASAGATARAAAPAALEPLSSFVPEECAPAGAGAIPPRMEQAPAPGAGQDRPAPGPPVPITPAAVQHADRRRKLILDAWSLAGREFQRLQAEGLDRDAVNTWGGLPAASSPPMTNLRAIVDELLAGESPDYAGAWTIIERRILVAGAEAQHQHRHLQYMTPSRMWNPDSFSIGSELSPGQVARGRARPRSSAERAASNEPPRRQLKTLTRP